MMQTRSRNPLPFLIVGLAALALAACSSSQDIAEGDAEPRQEVPQTSGGSQGIGLQASFRTIAADAVDVVTEIRTIESREQDQMNLFDFFFGPQQPGEPRQQSGLGSGVIVRRERNRYYVLTNDHVVGDADAITVGLPDGREFDGELVGTDPRQDLAVVRFTSSDQLPVARLGDSGNIRVGDWAIAVGNPFGFESTVTVGIISAVNREPEPGAPISGFSNFIQTDASINPGNSGGALLNLDGEVVGINTWIASQSGGSVGLGFAIPINTARSALEDLIEFGEVQYGWLGVSILTVGDGQNALLAEQLDLSGETGALVVNVHRDSPALDAGLFPGDLITSVNETNVDSATDLTRLVGNLAPDAPAEFALDRRGQQLTITTRLGRRPSEEDLQSGRDLWPGLSVIPGTARQREELDAPEDGGVIVASVSPESPAADAGLRAGDVILVINDSEVDDAGAFYQLLEAGQDAQISLRVLRSGREALAYLPALN